MAAVGRVFISYAHGDADRLVERLRNDLSTAGIEVWTDRHRLLPGTCWSQEIEQAIDDCTTLIAVLNYDAVSSAVCRAEQLRALRRGKQVIPVLAAESAPAPIHLEHLHSCRLSTPESYADNLPRLVDAITGGSPTEVPERHRRTSVTAPPLPPHFIARPTVMNQLREALVTSSPGETAGVIAITGMGGSGKSVLARRLPRRGDSGGIPGRYHLA